MTVRIRRRREGDLARCVTVLRAVHEADGYPLNWPAEPERWLTPAGLLGAWVAEDGHGGILGHVLLIRADQATAAVVEVSRLSVAPQARRQAIGRRLVEHVREVGQARRLRLVLDVIDGDPAAALYEATGWRFSHTSIADWTGPDGEPIGLRHYRAPG